MNAIRTSLTGSFRSIDSKFLQAVGNGAAYIFWITAALTLVALVAMIFLFDSPFRLQLGQLGALIALAMGSSIALMTATAKLLSARGEF